MEHVAISFFILAGGLGLAAIGRILLLNIDRSTFQALFSSWVRTIILDLTDYRG